MVGIGAWIAFLLALAVSLGYLHPIGPLPTPPSAHQAPTECQIAKTDKAAGGAMDPALYCK